MIDSRMNSVFIECLNNIILDQRYDDLVQSLREGKNYFDIDFNELTPEVKEILQNEYIVQQNSTPTIDEYITEKFLSISRAEGIPWERETVKIFFRNVEPKLRIRELTTDYLGGLVQLNGIVISTTPPMLHMKVATWMCTSCGTGYKVAQETDQLVKPDNCGCKKGRTTFILLKDESEYVDYQEIIIQENPDEVTVGDIPRTLRMRIRGKALVDKMRPGNMADITCAMIPMISRAKTDARIFALMFDLNCFDILNRESFSAAIEEGDIYELKYLSEQPDIVTILLDSIFPDIYGKTDEKLGLLLATIGGVDERRKRGTINVLMIGDPGVAKTRMLQCITETSPKAMYTSGRGVSGVGLTAAAIQDPIAGWRLEAGAVVLSDMGVCCVDEMDKMIPEDRENLHEAMSIQTVTIHKANIHTSLNARTTILGAANPKYGKYRIDEYIHQNIDLPVTLLSRFDLTFIMQDIVDEEEDEAIAETVLGMKDDDKRVFIPEDTIKKYILYAKTKKPKLSREAKDRFKLYYQTLRSISIGNTSPIAITVRQLEGLKRLGQAMARLHLREVVTTEDAQKVIDLMELSLSKAGFNPTTGKRDASMLEADGDRSKGEKKSIVSNILKNADGEIHLKAIYEESLGYGIGMAEAKNYVDEMERNGILYLSGEDIYCHFENVKKSDPYQRHLA